MAAVDSFFVTRTLQAIEVLAFQPSSAPEVADALKVDARTARRLLNRLADDGWVVRIDGRVRRYTLSLRLVALATQFVERAPLTRAATSVVSSLHERTGGVAHVTVPSYRSVLCLAHRAGDHPPRPHAGELIPAHATAAGKVLLAHRAPWRESVLERPLERVTERTVLEPDAVRSECGITLERGFAFEDGEYGAGSDHRSPGARPVGRRPGRRRARGTAGARCGITAGRSGGRGRRTRGEACGDRCPRSLREDHAERAYDALAPGYDDLTRGHDHAGWTALLEQRAHEAGLRGNRLLDVACGTGNTILPMLARDYEVTGVDVSQAMLAQARVKTDDRARLLRADMRDLPTLGEFDLIWCLGDALNYLDTPDDLAATLAGSRATSRPRAWWCSTSTRSPRSASSIRRSMWSRRRTVSSCSRGAAARTSIPARRPGPGSTGSSRRRRAGGRGPEARTITATTPRRRCGEP